jgi:hypothetical protein
MQGWLAAAGIALLFATASAEAQVNLSTRNERAAPAIAQPRTIDLRLIQEPAFNRFDPPTIGFTADTQIAPNARFGFRLLNVARPKPGPELRTDGRPTRTRRPGLSLTFAFR